MTGDWVPPKPVAGEPLNDYLQRVVADMAKYVNQREATRNDDR